jgi:DNA polymerase-1
MKAKNSAPDSWANALLGDAMLAKMANKGMRESFKTTPEVSDRIAKAVAQLKWPQNYHIANTEQGLAELADAINKNGHFIFDCETLGLDPWRDRLLCITYWVNGHGYITPLEHQMMTCVSPELVRKYLGPAFANPNIPKSNHHLTFDCHFVEEQLGIKVEGFGYDTLLQSQVINPDPELQHGLKELCAQYGLAPDTGNYKQQFGKTAWSYIHWKLACYYAIHDTELVEKLKQHQDHLLETTLDHRTGEARLKALFWDLEMPLLDLAYRMERTGILTDPQYFYETMRPTIYQEWEKAGDALRPYIDAHLKYVDAANVFQVLDSPARLKKVFFDKVGIPLVKFATLKRHKHKAKCANGCDKEGWTETTLDKNAIKMLEKEYPCLALLSEYRKWATAKKMFVDTYESKVLNVRIHPQVNVIGTVTGRFSMRNPNLQQVGARIGQIIRNLYIPEPGHTFWSVDFSGQEMRILAHYTGDPKLMDFYLNPNGLDIYTQTALDAFPDADFVKSKTTKTKFRLMSKGDRKLVNVYVYAKSLVLGLGYGMQSGKYSRETGKSKKDGQQDFDAYHAAYPRVKVFQNACISFTKKYGYMTTLLGRRRYFPFINSTTDNGLRLDAERACFNEPIQGSAADMVKLAALKVDRLIQKHQWPIRIVLLIHDEILFDAPIVWMKTNPLALELIQTTMKTALPLKVPMETTATIEPRWGSEMTEEQLEAMDLLVEEDEDVA